MDKILCGVDIGGTKLAIGLVTLEGRVIDTATLYDHVQKEADGVVDEIAETVGGLLRRQGYTEEHLLGIGVGTAGHLRYRDGVLITMSNLRGFKDYPLRARLQSRFVSPVRIDNDANEQAYGEFRYGAGRGYADMVFMTLSTQIGAGVILGGRLYRGMTGTAGEIGHTIVEPHGELVCPCGNRGCLIAVASGVALPAVFRRKLDAGMRSKLAEAAAAEQGAFSLSGVDGAFVKRGLEAGDEVCVDIVRDYSDYIGIGVYNIFQMLNPQAVVLGGGLLNWGPRFFEGIRERFRSLARDMLFDPVAIVREEIGANAGVVGAASLVLEEP